MALSILLTVLSVMALVVSWWGAGAVFCIVLDELCSDDREAFGWYALPVVYGALALILMAVAW